MLEQLDLRPGHRVLEIGVGSGYNAALLGTIVGPTGRVVSIDIQPDLVEAANRVLAAHGLDWVQAVAGDGGYGYAQDVPYDRILLTVGTAVITPAWREQLIDGGRLVLPITVGKTQKSVAFELHGEELVSLSVSDCGFMVLQGAFASPPPINIQVGSDPQLKVVGDHPLALSGEQIDRLLSGPYVEYPSGITLQITEIWSGLLTWLSLVEPGWAQLIAENQAADQKRIPEFFYIGDGQEFRTRLTALLACDEELSVLVRPPGQVAPLMNWNSPKTDDAPPEQPFEPYVRQYGAVAPGASGSSASRLLAALRSWHSAGQPTSKRLRLKAIPAEQEYHPGPGEYLLDKPWTKIIASFPE